MLQFLRRSETCSSFYSVKLPEKKFQRPITPPYLLMAPTGSFAAFVQPRRLETIKRRTEGRSPSPSPRLRHAHTDNLQSGLHNLGSSKADFEQSSLCRHKALKPLMYGPRDVLIVSCSFNADHVKNPPQ